MKPGPRSDAGEVQELQVMTVINVIASIAFDRSEVD
jgi:hypothetical protein